MSSSHRRTRQGQAGFTLIELIMFVVIVAIGVAGVLSVFNATVRSSADPAARKQMIAIAEAMLEEVELMPFTCRDPDDPTAADASVALSGNNCVVGGTMEGLGPEAGPETRYSATIPFDNVNDYNGFDTNTAVPSGILDPSATLAGPAGYRAVVAISAQNLGPAATPVTANDGNGRLQSLLIDVTVTSPRGETLTLSGYRARYAPTSPP
ncbi:MAG TPA: prepilin-type N-terminal cleavage/methylation domain-containing protein [Burkholderiales bacterium]